MLIIGLTGSVGMGKSTVAARFRERGIPVCDADALVHALYEGEAVAPIEAAFPGSTTDGKVDRQRLSALLLADPAGFKRLEGIVHPMVHQAELECLRAAEMSGATMAVLEVPLLLEAGKDKYCDVTVVVSASAEIQRERVLARPGMTAEKLEAVLRRQMPDADKRARADFVVDTGIAIAETLAQVDGLIDRLLGRRGEAFGRNWR